MLVFAASDTLTLNFDPQEPEFAGKMSNNGPLYTSAPTKGIKDLTE